MIEFLTHGFSPQIDAQLRWEEFPPCVNSIYAREILCLYVDEPYHGKGFAQALMQKCFAEFEAKGSDPVWLGVWEYNPRAISFYRKLVRIFMKGDHSITSIEIG
ncbi:TPA: GNAT family N-acetyltransferase [Escherichia coli]|uniref:GNAT family N-acetyltransferase n=1 Tax=Escherichia coli TaxID=562 RepID=UPI000DDD8A00|nr:GNAT family N-acetyltransferase [Escherichia coli]HDT4574455.1 GNAT family N-acetyltransferase [Escherichia coli]